MAEFNPINTQEELNNIIGERIRRERETVTKDFQAQISAKDTEIKGFKTNLADLQKKLDEANEKVSGIQALEDKIRGYERASVKNKVAREIGIPEELADRLAGETEEELRKDAEAVRKLIGQRATAPLAGGERAGAMDASKDAAWLAVSKQISNT